MRYLTIVALIAAANSVTYANDAELLRLQMEVARLVQRVDAIESKPAYAMPAGRTLYLITSPNCLEPCSKAKAAAMESGVPVVELNPYEEPFEVVKLWQSTPLEFNVPAWVLKDNDRVIHRWVGAGSAKSVRNMAEYKDGPRIVSIPVVASAVTYERGVPVSQTVVRDYSMFQQPQQRASIPPARQQWWQNGHSVTDQHLMSHGINPAGMSQAEKDRAHSHAHLGTWNPAWAQPTYSQPIYRQPVRQQRTVNFGRLLPAMFSGCPSGVCPR